MLKLSRLTSVFLLSSLIFLLFPATNTHAASNWEYVGGKDIGTELGLLTSIQLHPTTYEPYVVYQTFGNKIYAMLFNGTNWSSIGPTFEIASGQSPTLAFHPTTNEAYVAYTDIATLNKLTVKKYSGGSWSNVGTAGVSVGAAYSPQIAFSPTTNEPYVAYIDNSQSNELTVLKYNGATWETVGAAGFTADDGNYPSLFFDAAGAPYLAFSDKANAWKISMYKYNSGITTWELLGTAGFSDGTASYINGVYTTGNSRVSVVFRDAGFSNRVRVVYLNGGSWSEVGTKGLSAGYSQEISMTADPTNSDLYVAFREEVGSEAATSVKKYSASGGSWSYLGNPGFSDGTGNSNDITLHPTSKIPYVVFTSSNVKPTIMKYSTVSGASLHRFWSDSYKGHFYTTSEAEKANLIANNPNWGYEFVAYQVFSTNDCSGRSTVFRFWSDTYKRHFYTIDPVEKYNLIANNSNWTYEFEAFCAYKYKTGNSKPVHRFWSDAYKGHFYTTSEDEKNSIIMNNPNWTYEGIAYYVL